MKTRVVNMKTEAYDVRIDRRSKWGNPFKIGPGCTREHAIACYEKHLHFHPELMAALPELAGKRLGCWCKPRACHGDVLVKLIGEIIEKAKKVGE